MTREDPYTRPVAESAALLLIDVQRDFLDTPGREGPIAVAGTHAVIPAIAKLRLVLVGKIVVSAA